VRELLGARHAAARDALRVVGVGGVDGGQCAPQAIGVGHGRQ